MLRRAVRISFRLTHAEHERFKPLFGSAWCWTWSELCRLALAKMASEREAKEASDNGVRQADPLSDSRSTVIQTSRPTAQSKKKKRQKPQK
jgi:hypothetical protein